jgi:iron complex outermembrane receptor protein
MGEEGYFKAVDKSLTALTLPGYKMDLADDLIVRLNLASGFRAPNLAELTSNGVHEGTNRYEIGNSDLKTEQNVQSDINLEYNNSHFEFFVNGFIIISITIFILHLQEGFNNDVFSYIQNNAKLYGGEIGLHFHPHFRLVAL